MKKVMHYSQSFTVNLW